MQFNNVMYNTQNHFDHVYTSLNNVNMNVAFTYAHKHMPCNTIYSNYFHFYFILFNIVVMPQSDNKFIEMHIVAM